MDLDKFERFISNSFCNVGQSFYDKYVEANVNFRSKLGMKEVIIRRQLGHCCDWCASLAGIYNAWNMSADIHDNIYRRHRNCRCLVTYKSEDGYQDVWNKKIYQTQRDARIEKIDSIMQNGSPLAIKVDTSNYDVYPKEGTKHSAEEINKLKIFARNKGFQLIDFDNFDGDIDLAKEFINNVSEETERYHLLRKKRINIRCSYALDKDTFAETVNSTITINGFAYRNRQILEKEYQKAVEDGWFTANSTYNDIPTHESAHVVTYLNSLKKKDLLYHVFDTWNPDEIAELSKEHISLYAGVDSDELIAESYTAYKTGSTDSFVLKTLDLCGIFNLKK